VSEVSIQSHVPAQTGVRAANRLDCIYVAASARDGRHTRACIASIRHFYPDAPVKLLVGGPLEPGLEQELQTYWNVGLADIPRGNWGWGFIKLEPLFGPPGERFLILDSDTVLGGEVLASWAECEAPFLVDEEEETESETHRLYYNWREVAKTDPQARPPAFTFNSGNWFGTAGILTREDFALLVDWSGMPPQLRRPDCFMPGDQGVLNYVLNQKIALEGLAVGRRKIAHWPGRGMHGFSAETVATRTAPPLVVHWAGLKKAWFGAMEGSDVLEFFERRYFERLPIGGLRRAWSVLRSVASEVYLRGNTRLRRDFTRLTQLGRNPAA
jgi:hypothetical protein